MRKRKMSSRHQAHLRWSASAVMALGAAFVQPGAAAEKKTLAFVVNVPADFWTIARRGTEKAQKELPNYNIEFYIPGEMSAAAQKRILEDLLAKGVAGVSISPVNPDNSTEILNQVAVQGRPVHAGCGCAELQPR